MRKFSHLFDLFPPTYVCFMEILVSQNDSRKVIHCVSSRQGFVELTCPSYIQCCVCEC